MAQNTPRGTPARVLLLFGLLTGAVVVSSLRDARRDDLFRVSYPTAVGDTGYHRPGGEPLSVGIDGTVFQLLEEPADRLSRRDDRMFRVPLAVPEPRLYTTAESLPPNEVPPLYLKTSDGEYLRVELRAAATRKAPLSGAPRAVFP